MLILEHLKIVAFLLVSLENHKTWLTIKKDTMFSFRPGLRTEPALVHALHSHA